MKILVVSDSHSKKNILADLRDKYSNEVDYFIHCGDSELDPNSKWVSEYTIVEGNCDYYDYPEKEVVATEEGNILVTHGHLYGVNYGLDRLALLAKQENAKFVFYGHTHRLAVEYVDGTLFLNPGSVWFPRGEYQKLGGTYAIVSVNESKIKVTYYTREGLAPVSELQFEYQK